MASLEERLDRLERENTEIQRRLATVEGQFEFISGQLRTIQTYMHGKFEQVDARFDRVEHGLSSLRQDMPGIVSDAMREVLRQQKPN